VSVDTVTIVKVKVKFAPEEDTRAQSRRRHPYYFFNLGARWGWVVNATPRPLYSRERPG
jgi:hypothetical protein